jgi:hypothetical protein
MLANNQRSHAGPRTLKSMRDDLPALADAAGWARLSSDSSEKTRAVADESEQSGQQSHIRDSRNQHDGGGKPFN